MRHKFFLLLVFAVLLVQVPSFVRADAVMHIAPSLAPNVFGSPSWSPYVVNALSGLSTNTTSVGADPRTTDPTGYRVTHNVDPAEMIVSGFPSWYGVANPAAPFASELGTRLHMGLSIIGDGTTQFRLNDLAFSLSSTDPGNALAFGGNFAGSDYSATRYGVNWGADRAPGGGDDTIYTSGNGLTLVDALYYVGVGNAFAVYDTDPGATRQDKLNNAIAGVAGISPFDVDINYTMYASDGHTVIASADDVVHVGSVPTPSAVASGALLLSLGIGARIYRRRSR